MANDDSGTCLDCRVCSEGGTSVGQKTGRAAAAYATLGLSEVRRAKDKCKSCGHSGKAHGTEVVGDFGATPRPDVGDQAEELTMNEPDELDIVKQTEADATPAPGNASDGGLSHIHEKARQVVLRELIDGETVQVVALGMSKQAMVATHRRVLVVKPGWMAGNAFGSNCTSFYYENVAGVEFQKKFTTSILAIRAAGFEASNLQVGKSGKGNDVYEAANGIPVKSDPSAQRFVQVVNKILSDLRAYGSQAAPVASINTDPTEALQRLIEMKAAGHIDDDEFKAMKAKIISDS